MIMGFILPFILTFVAIPFESFVSSARTVLGLMASWGLRTLAFLLRLLGNLGFYFSRMVINIYDLLICPALWIEGIIIRAVGKNRVQKNEDAEKDDSQKHKLDNSTLMGGTGQCNEITD